MNGINVAFLIKKTNINERVYDIYKQFFTLYALLYITNYTFDILMVKVKKAFFVHILNSKYNAVKVLTLI